METFLFRATDVDVDFGVEGYPNLHD
ncbi:hypothetical protein CCACVL1_21644 [Corchorus capsularis]|uniref:Uncharacterized protein n=1 Tax=Corchorus capsularis TaxID=210143 RepID=A0A1R3H2M7_COCAP|nr:hypothetical protein CCACVL1_21644 [Corchorus capsularis]